MILFPAMVLLFLGQLLLVGALLLQVILQKSFFPARSRGNLNQAIC
jgi:hypothetical protein